MLLLSIELALLLFAARAASELAKRLSLPPVVGEFVQERKERLERVVHRPVDIQIDPTLPWEDYRIVID